MRVFEYYSCDREPIELFTRNGKLYTRFELYDGKYCYLQYRNEINNHISSKEYKRVCKIFIPKKETIFVPDDAVEVKR